MMKAPENLNHFLHDNEKPDILLELHLEALKASFHQQLQQIEQEHQSGLESRILQNSLLSTSTAAPLKCNGPQDDEKSSKSGASAYQFAKPRRSSSTPNLSSKWSQNKYSISSCIPRADITQSQVTQSKTNLRTSMEIQEELDWAECQKQFHVSPVPVHVFKSMYNDIVQEQDRLRQEGRQQRKEFLLSIQKPFTFHQREVQRSDRSKPETAQDKQNEKRKLVGRRKPIHKLTDEATSEHLKEKEQQRKIRIKERAQETLMASSPPNLSQTTRAEQQTRSAQRSKSRVLGFLDQMPSFRPKTNTKVPDFDKLYQAFHQEAMERSERREVTVCQPFRLRTSELEPRHSRSSLDKSPKSANMSLKRSSSFGGLASLSRDTLPTYITDAARKRSMAIRKSMELRESKEQENAEWMRQHRMNSQALSTGVSARAKAMDPHRSLKEVYQEKLKQHRQADKERMKDYKRELQDMRARVTARPYLFEQVSQKNAKNDAERIYRNTLEQAGLDEHFVKSKGERDESQKSKTSHSSCDSDGDHSSETEPSQREGNGEDRAQTEEETEDEGMSAKGEELS